MNNVKDMSYIFSGCLSLSTLPYISKWNINNVNYTYDIFDIFRGCSSLSSLPDISKWNANDISYMSYIL